MMDERISKSVREIKRSFVALRQAVFQLKDEMESAELTDQKRQAYDRLQAAISAMRLMAELFEATELELGML
jgi:hypothetical protein